MKCLIINMAQRGIVWVIFRIDCTLHSASIGYFMIFDPSVKGTVDEACAIMV